MSLAALAPDEAAARWSSPSFLKEEQDVARRSTLPFLTTSPYTDQTHLLDLSTVNRHCQLLARALTVMTSIRTDYATAPYIEAFNWEEVMTNLRWLLKEEAYEWSQRSFYVVVFRSQIPPTTDRSHLSLLDRASHEEAVKGGGLLKYWFGVPDGAGRNLATCVWRDTDDAKRGSAGKGHRRASAATKGLYTEWHIERLQLSIGDRAEHWTINDWRD
ncbi:MAG: hypothetical protein M1816_002259 [Peltula sp. TS41687]|nr:MAG: hypothetical protein M1816_002259 [Peltula sp. TS41687]